MSDPAIQDTESIDLQAAAASLKRSWRWIAVGGACGLAGGAFVNLTTPSTWEGEFQIVVNQGQSSGSSASALLGQATSLLGLGGTAGGNQLETELQILQSPSVLEPVYQRSFERREGLPFRSWRNQVSVTAAKGTNVITVRYRDSNPDAILPITKDISNAYQSYSGRQRRREIDNALDYLQEQINALRPRAESQREDVERFMTRYQLTPADGVPASGIAADSNTSINLLGGGSATQILSNLNNLSGNPTKAETSLNNRRIQLQEQRRDLELKLRHVQKAGNRYVALPGESLPNTASRSLGTSSALGSIINTGNSTSLSQLDIDISERRSRFTANDPVIKRLERERRVLIQEINQQSARAIQTNLQLNASELAALDRPTGVIETFQRLFQQANRTESTLLSLENSLAQLKLEQARQTLPWDLISTPTMLPAPVEPRRGRLLGFGLLAGLVAGGAAGLLVERSSGRIYDRDELVNLLELPLLGSIPGTSPQLLASGPLKGPEGLALMPLGRVPTSTLDHLAHQLEGVGCRTVQTVDELVQTLDAPSSCLVATPGSTTRSQLNQLRANLRLTRRQPAGVIWISE